MSRKAEAAPLGSDAASEVKAAATPLNSAAHLIGPAPRPVLTTAEVYEIIRGRLVAHVIVKDTLGKVTTRPYRNIGAADRAMRRARERGYSATVVMVRQDVAPLLGGDL